MLSETYALYRSALLIKMSSQSVYWMTTCCQLSTADYEVTLKCDTVHNNQLLFALQSIVRCDVMLVMEIKDAKGQAFPRLMTHLNRFARPNKQINIQ